GVDGGGDAPQAGAATRGRVHAAPAALACRDARRCAAAGGALPHLGAPPPLGPRPAAHRGRRRPGRPVDPGLVGAGPAGREGPGGLPAGHVHPLHGPLRHRALPLAGALAGPPRRLPVQPADEAAGPGAHPASARLARPGDPHPQRGRLGPVRGGALPLAAVRRTRTLPPRGGSGHFLHRTGQLAEGPRAGSVTDRTRPVLAPRISQLGTRQAVIDLGAGADVGVWAGRTTTVTQAAIAARRAVSEPTSEAVHRRWQVRPSGWESRAFSVAGPAGSPYACATPRADRRPPVAGAPPRRSRPTHSAQLSLSTSRLAARPLAMSSRISSTVSAYPVSPSSRELAKTTP